MLKKDILKYKSLKNDEEREVLVGLIMSKYLDGSNSIMEVNIKDSLVQQVKNKMKECMMKAIEKMNDTKLKETDLSIESNLRTSIKVLIPVIDKETKKKPVPVYPLEMFDSIENAINFNLLDTYNRFNWSPLFKKYSLVEKTQSEL